MFKYIVPLLVIIVSECDTLCELEDLTTYCSSVHDVRKMKQQQNWTDIFINSQEKQRINPYSFAKTPNVERIRFQNAVNDIEEFSFYDLSSLQYLEFYNCDLQIIKKNWFGDSSIEQLFVENSNVKSFEANCFQGSTNLTHATFHYNNISRIPGNVFSGTSIVFLDLEKNNIQFIQENAFINMPHLLFISLVNNSLTSFNPKLILGDGGVSNLQHLNLHFNKITKINHFDTFKSLSTITLAFNQIETIDKGALNGLSNLGLLDVSCNKLKAFPESVLPYTGLPSLIYLRLGNNRINYMSRSFIRYFPKLKEIDIFGNPWQCGIYKDIINSILYHNISIIFAEKYLNGTRPVCVVGNDMCVENMQLTDDLYNYYIQEIYSCSDRSRFSH